MTSTPSPAKRYYGDDLRVHPEIDLRALIAQLHALYTHWVIRNWHQRDFIGLAEHAARYLLAEHLAGDRPALAEPKFIDLPLAQPAAWPMEVPPRRLYDELSALNPGADTESAIKLLGPHFAAWHQGGWHVRDFVEAVHAAATAVVYGHHLAQQFGGLGGGKDSKQFLSTRFEG